MTGLKKEIRAVCAEEFLVCGEGDEQGSTWMEKAAKTKQLKQSWNIKTKTKRTKKILKPRKRIGVLPLIVDDIISEVESVLPKLANTPIPPTIHVVKDHIDILDTKNKSFEDAEYREEINALNSNTDSQQILSLQLPSLVAPIEAIETIADSHDTKNNSDDDSKYWEEISTLIYDTKNNSDDDNKYWEEIYTLNFSNTQETLPLQLPSLLAPIEVMETVADIHNTKNRQMTKKSDDDGKYLEEINTLNSSTYSYHSLSVQSSLVTPIEVIETNNISEISIYAGLRHSTACEPSLDELQRKIVEYDLKCREQKFELEISHIRKTQDIQQNILLVELQHKKRLLEMAEEEHIMKLSKF